MVHKIYFSLFQYTQINYSICFNCFIAAIKRFTLVRDNGIFLSYVSQHSKAKKNWIYRHQTWQMDSTRQDLVTHFEVKRSNVKVGVSLHSSECQSSSFFRLVCSYKTNIMFPVCLVFVACYNVVIKVASK